ncbi:Lsr2 family protein [Nocardioides sp. InS609-2]|uniref:histone-like nucleoid-structuring protein Lsr2 n=1 Tax=Nocardioides sp. InS609-2 TaxID=2760705 RepID=UPI00179EDA2E|nr:Lsr2 family protein [Nocardioides sp. InS609-2]MBA3781847.1 Lsr2 family protein [Nocardioides sp.]
MSQKVSIILVDDIDGGDASETVQFGLDGASYEIDLSESNASALRDALSGYVGHARKVGSGRRTRRAGAASTSGVNAKEVRAWARANKRSVPDRGRIPADVREAYDAAH